MNTSSANQHHLYLDRPLPETTPLNSWRRLNAGDEFAEGFEGLLRAALVLSLFCAVLICAMRLHPADGTGERNELALPSVHLPQMMGEAKSAVRAALPATATRSEASVY